MMGYVRCAAKDASASAAFGMHAMVILCGAAIWSPLVVSLHLGALLCEPNVQAFTYSANPVAERDVSAAVTPAEAKYGHVLTAPAELAQAYRFTSSNRNS